MEAAMPAKKKASERREAMLNIRLTDAEQKRLNDAARLFPAMTKSQLVRVALMAGLDVIEREGITLAPQKPRR